MKDHIQLINELQGISKIRDLGKQNTAGDENQQAYAQMTGAMSKLTDLGWQEMGLGAFGAVFFHPKYPYVLKVFDSRDRCYLQFLKTIQSVKNPHFPKIKGKPLKITDYLVAIRLEKLEHKPMPEKVEKILKRIGGGVFPINVESTFRSLLLRYPENADFIKALKISYEIVKQSGCNWDMHENNIMYRGSTPVIIDPVI